MVDPQQEIEPYLEGAAQKSMRTFGVVDLFGTHGDTVEIPWSSVDQAAMAPNGSLSESNRASQDKGRRFHEHMVDNLVRFIQWMREQNGPIGRTPADVRGKEQR